MKRILISISLCVGILTLSNSLSFSYPQDNPTAENEYIEEQDKFAKAYLKTCPLREEDDADGHHWAFNMVFYVGVLLMIATCGVIIFFIVSTLPKRIKICPVSYFGNSQKILIPSFQDKNIVIPPESEDFAKIINDFTDEKQDSDYSTYSGKIYLRIKNKLYTLEISIAGWNFLGEEKNCRRLRNPIELAQLIDSIREKSK